MVIGTREPEAWETSAAGPFLTICPCRVWSRGNEGFRIESPACALLANWDQWDDAFDDFTVEVEEYIDGDAYVLAVTHWRAKGKDSGLVIEQRSVDIYEFADGKIVGATVGYSDKDTARKAVGLAG